MGETLVVVHRLEPIAAWQVLLLTLQALQVALHLGFALDVRGLSVALSLRSAAGIG
jgi:hypothetical protein